ncbi:MAG TPA: acyl-CoA thioesterase domain-containing protein, partial [Acidimicrobiales bacterium]|nr:acyl-CoA thioesterase domain-containing protein [Acidimicrobiales bacterium]
MQGVETAESTFAAQTTLTADDEVPGRYRVNVSPDWNCPTVPQGGLMSAIAARAMELELARPAANGNGSGGDQTLRSLTTVYAAPVPAGPVTIDVDVLR